MKAKVTAVKVQNPESEDSELSGGAIAGIVVGCVAVVAVFVIIAAVWQHRFRMQQNDNDGIELA